MEMINIPKFQPVIKWTGSKRYQAEDIVKYFPKEIDTYYEPFIGGGSVFRQLLDNKHKINKYICSDINQDLINLWNVIKNNPQQLFHEYLQRWETLKQKEGDQKKEYFYKIRNNYNYSKNVFDFYFLTRTCLNGLIRYNSKNQFNSAFHYGRDGIIPEKLKRIIYDWHNKIKSNNIIFTCKPYNEIIPKEDDFMYLDPPYANTDAMYFGKIQYECFWEWIRKLKCKYALSFDGTSGQTDNTYNVPKDIYSEHLYMNKGISGFKKLQNKQEYVRESLYIK